MDNKGLVVVLTRNHSTGLSVIRSLGEAGYAVDVIAEARKEGGAGLIAASRYVNSFTEIVAEKVSGEEDRELISALMAYEGCEKKPVLFPTDDYTASVMDGCRSSLEDIFIMPGPENGGNGSLTRIMHKGVQGEMARASGMLTPEEWVISLRGEISIPDDVIYPCFVKPAQSFLGYKQEMKKCDSRDILMAHLVDLKERYSDREMLVQRFLEIDNEIDIEGVCLNQEVMLPGVVWKSIVARYDRGVPLAGEVMPFDRFGDLKEHVERLLKSYRYTGLFDLGINIVGGEYYFNELNLRSGGTNFAYFGSGVNLPDIFVKKMTGEEVSEGETIIREFGKTYYYENMGWDDYFGGYLSKDEIDRLYEEADIRFIHNDKDSEPEKIFLEEKNKRYIRRQMRDECVAATMVKSGWDQETALMKVKSARKRLGISYADYDRYDFWKIDEDRQQEEYDILIAKREEYRRKRKECIDATVEKSGWDEEYAAQMIKSARERIGISFGDYDRYDFWKIDEDRQQAEYDAILEKRAEKKKKRAECIARIQEKTGWYSDEADRSLREAWNGFGASQAMYEKLELWKYPYEEQKRVHEEYLAKKERRRLQKERCIKESMEAMGWTLEEAENWLKDARDRFGITYNDYAKYEFYRVPLKKQEKEYGKLLKKKKK